jgi:hypothetical protein
VHASVRKFKVDPEQMDEILRRITDGFIPQIADAPGFTAYHAVDAGNGILITVTLGDDLDAVERSTEIGAEFVRTELSDLDVERVEAAHGEVRITQVFQ